MLHGVRWRLGGRLLRTCRARPRERLRQEREYQFDFIRRFLLHALPPGFQRIRFGGFFANCHRREKLALIRQLLTHPVAELLPLPSGTAALLELLTGTPAHQCPACGVGHMIVIETLPPIRWAPPGWDTS